MQQLQLNAGIRVAHFIELPGGWEQEYLFSAIARCEYWQPQEVQLLPLSIQIVMKLKQTLRKLRRIFIKLDFFPTTQFLCYKGQNSFATATGGLISVVVISVFFALFLNGGLAVVNKSNVKSESLKEQTAIPSLVQVVTSPEGGFMFFLNILGAIDKKSKLFDVYLLQQEYAPYGILVNSTQIPLQPCTPAHMAFGSQLQGQFDRIGGSDYLCPPLSYSFQLQGTLLSQTYKVFKIQVTRCNTTLSSNCASDSVVTETQNSIGGSFLVLLGTINTLINAASSDEYKSWYFEDGNQFWFSTKNNVMVKAAVAEYEIETDQSLWPFEQTKSQTGNFIAQPFTYQNVESASGLYFQAIFQRSRSNYKYSRSFKKLDEFCSYVGGLVGAILGLLLIVGIYNEVCYYLSVGDRLFRYDSQQVNSSQFNFCTFIAGLFYKLVRLFGCFEHTPSHMKIFYDTQEEVKQQLDVVYLMQRLICLEKTIQRLTTATTTNATNTSGSNNTSGNSTSRVAASASVAYWEIKPSLEWATQRRKKLQEESKQRLEESKQGVLEQNQWSLSRMHQINRTNSVQQRGNGQQRIDHNNIQLQQQDNIQLQQQDEQERQRPTGQEIRRRKQFVIKKRLESRKREAQGFAVRA